MIRDISLDGLMDFLLNTASFKEVCEAMLKARERKLENWEYEIKNKYPEGDPFKGVAEGIRKEITMIKMCLGGLT